MKSSLPTKYDHHKYLKVFNVSAKLLKLIQLLNHLQIQKQKKLQILLFDTYFVFKNFSH